MQNNYKISSWNLNSLKARWNLLQQFLNEEKPDFVLLQETKTQDENFSTQELQNLGYKSFFRGEKMFNGVAILYKNALDCRLISDKLFDDQPARFLEVEFECCGRKTSLISIYAPNGEDVGLPKFDYKLDFLDQIYQKLNDILQSEKEIIIGGDFNIAPSELDLWHPDRMKNSCSFTLTERKKIARLQNLGLLDPFRLLNSEKQQYSWWDYRHGNFQKDRGMRIDYFLVTPFIMQKTTSIEMQSKWRAMEKPSDHIPVVLEIGSN